MVGAASHKVKLQKRLASPASQLQVYCLQQVEHLQAFFTELTVCRTAALLVRHHMKVYYRLCTVLRSWLYGDPLDRLALHEHRRTLPLLFPLDELHVMVPQVDVLDGTFPAFRNVVFSFCYSVVTFWCRI